MVNYTKPTGDSDCPAHIRRAKHVAREIEQAYDVDMLDDEESKLPATPIVQNLSEKSETPTQMGIVVSLLQGAQKKPEHNLPALLASSLSPGRKEQSQFCRTLQYDVRVVREENRYNQGRYDTQVAENDCLKDQIWKLDNKIAAMRTYTVVLKNQLGKEITMADLGLESAASELV